MRRVEPRPTGEDALRRSGLRGPGAVVAVCALAVAFAALAGAAHAGWMDSLASFSDRELSPLQYGVQRDHPFAVSWLNAPLTAAVSLATPTVSILLCAGGCALLARSGRRRRAVLWAVAMAVAVAVEVLAKQLVDPGYPSGHAIRAIVLAGLAAELWPRYAPAAVGIAVAVIVGLQLKGAHPPADIAGGVLVGLAIVIAVRAWEPRLPQKPA